MKKILIINTGGTFNKTYNPLTGNLDIDKKGNALKEIAKYWLNDFKIINILGKDSLDMKTKHRERIVKSIIENIEKHIIIIHGTDTMDKTAEFLEKYITDKTLLLTGAMVPYSIDSVEANANLSMSLGYLLSNRKNGIYISMHGLVDEHKKVYKNRNIGVFQIK